ncbi:hypothetical protein LCGC14_1825980 [marine sediment metagenome]|uniref:Uncharacterized protein n=1 Tax=marine sediment metagenome TaxID=412755 RepID=A0A0F9IX82_9ZZZZ
MSVSHALNAYEKQCSAVSQHVWFMGTGALLEGQAVCFNWDFGTAGDVDCRRFNRVEPPSITNAQFFAGVAARDYSANANGATRPQLIEIYGPGSLCKVLGISSASDTVIGVGRLTFEITSAVATNGTFRYSGLAGEGSCIPMQTQDVSDEQLILALLDPPGLPSGGLEVITAINNSAIGTVMVGGTTLVTGVALGDADCTYILPDATRDGLRKKIKVITSELTTNDFVVTVTTGRTHALADSGLATVTWAGASTTVDMQVTLEWDEAWIVQTLSKVMPALA